MTVTPTAWITSTVLLEDVTAERRLGFSTVRSRFVAPQHLGVLSNRVWLAANRADAGVVQH